MRHDSIGYWWLVERYRRMGYDAHAIAERYDEHGEDVLVNVFYALSLRALARLDAEQAPTCGRRAPTGPRRRCCSAAMTSGTGLFFDLAGRGERQVAVSTWSSLAPLALPGMPEDVRRRLDRGAPARPARYRAQTRDPVGGALRAHVQPALRAVALLARARVDEHGVAARAADDASSATWPRPSASCARWSWRRTRRLSRVLQPAHRARPRRARLRVCHIARRSSRRMRDRWQRAVRPRAHHADVSWRSTRAAGQTATATVRSPSSISAPTRGGSSSSPSRRRPPRGGSSPTSSMRPSASAPGSPPRAS